MPGDFRVTTNMADRAMVVTCEPCADSLSIALSEPGFTRLLALFAARHDHADGAEQSVELRALRLVEGSQAER